jgi:hypothetical protein
MKTRVPTILLGRTLQAASAIYTTAPDDTTDVITTFVSYEHEEGAIDQELTVFLPKEQQLATTPPASFLIPPEWDPSSAARFNHLVEKEALGLASSEDIEQLEGLSALRRRALVPRTGQEVMREYEQGQLIRDLLRSLTRYVEFAKPPADRSSKTRAGAKTKTSGV